MSTSCTFKIILARSSSTWRCSTSTTMHGLSFPRIHQWNDLFTPLSHLSLYVLSVRRSYIQLDIICKVCAGLVGYIMSSFAVLVLNKAGDNGDNCGRPEHQCSGSNEQIPWRQATLLCISVASIKFTSRILMHQAFNNTYEIYSVTYVFQVYCQKVVCLTLKYTMYLNAVCKYCSIVSRCIRMHVTDNTV